MQRFTGSVRTGTMQHYGAGVCSDFLSEQPPESEMSTEPNQLKLIIKIFLYNSGVRYQDIQWEITISHMKIYLLKK